MEVRVLTGPRPLPRVRRLAPRAAPLVLAAAMALGLAGGAGARADLTVGVSQTADEIVVDVSGPDSIPYQARISKSAFAIKLTRDGQTVLGTATNTAALAATRAGTKVTGGQVLDSAFDGTQLVMHVAASNGGDPFTVTATPGADR